MAERKKFIEDWGGAVAIEPGCVARKRSAPRETAFDRRLSERLRREPSGNPLSRPDTPLPAVDGQNH